MAATPVRSRIVHGSWLPWIALILGTSVVAQAADLHVMKTGLGDGTISGTGISCGIIGPTESTDCEELGLAPAASVELSVTVGAGVSFTAWGGDCSMVLVTPPATPTCTVTMNALRRVRANFERLTVVPTIADFTPEGIQTFLNANTAIDTPAEFVAALPRDFRQNWILMPRSESLQTGIAALPRILLPSADATRVFTLGMTPSHTSYPGAHPLAIEYMQWDARPEHLNFRFHEVVVAPAAITIPALGGSYDHDLDPATPPVPRFAARGRGVSADDQKCFACHSTRNVINLNPARSGPGTTPGTTGTTPQTVKFKSKPNWDTYDSWGGMVPFNRDRIYKGSLEAAAFRTLFNLWTWQGNESVRAVIEQLELQPTGVPDGMIPQQSGVADHRIRRDVFNGGANDGYVVFGFDPLPFTPAPEPNPSGTLVASHTAYEFNDRAGVGAATDVVKDGDFLTLHHSVDPTSDEGRGVELFDLLTQGPNPRRIADEMIPKPPLTDHYATGNTPIDVRPFAIAIADGCIGVGGGTAIGATQTITGVSTALTAAVPFFDARNGLSFDQVYDDTRRRAQSLTRRKADIERTTLDRDADLYVFDPTPFDGMPIEPSDRVDGLIRRYGAGTLGIAGGTGGEDRSLARLRQEVFRRAPPPGHLDETAIGRVYVDREDDSTDSPPPPAPPRPDNTAKAALYRYFLEPLGISVDKWSMGVRGRSRTYTFADLFGGYSSRISSTLKTSLGLPLGTPCTAAMGTSIMGLVDAQVARLPTGAIPTFTDVQRIFNKACIECHGGLTYPPYRTYGTSFDLSENENPSPAAPFPLNRRLGRSYRTAFSATSAPTGPPGMEEVGNSYLFERITDDGLLAHPYNPLEPFDVADPNNPADPDVADERCPSGLMPCEGPPLSKTDIETIKRWIIGGRSFTEGDPHIRTVEGIHYDFQGAGEFVLLRDEGMELQARQSPVTTAGPLPPNPYTGLSTCVSVNTAVAMQVAGNRVSYQPEITARPNDELATDRTDAAKPRRLILRVDGKPVTLGADGIALSNGGRIARTGEPGGIEVHFPGGTSIAVTPGWWPPHRIWYMNIDVRHARAVEGVMGAIAPNNWLPALSTGALLGRQPVDRTQRHRDLYETFANSWRVDAASSLFDYEPGLSPQSFVVEDWPVSEIQSCLAPAQPGGPVPAPPPTPIPEAEAEQLCREVVDPERRTNCVLDVVATGEVGFAKTYLATDKLDRRFLPAPPTLVSPVNDARLKPEAVDFQWTAPLGTGNVSYRHCIWNADELYDFNRCLKVGASGGSLPDRIVSVAGKYLRFGGCIALLVALCLIALFLIVRYRIKGLLVALALALVLLAILLALDRRHSGGQLETRVAKLEPGKVYFWKVVAETPDGMVIESKTRRFEVAQ